VLLAQCQHAVNRRGQARRCRVRFHQSIHEMEALAESALDGRLVPFAGIGARKAASPFDDVGRSTETLCREEGRGDPALCRMRGLDALAGRA
jgi:hypothetical protein